MVIQTGYLQSQQRSLLNQAEDESENEATEGELNALAVGAASIGTVVMPSTIVSDSVNMTAAVTNVVGTAVVGWFGCLSSSDKSWTI